MCGINAIYGPDRPGLDKTAIVARMNKQMIYRGPDEAGIHANGKIALGMRRLSIIDVAGGHQPLYNEDGSLALVFNGEIYNYVELRQDLQRQEHRFATGSDGETILHLYEENGERCLEHLRGMFAFVLWDAARGRVFAARDRVGIKPLYVAEYDGLLWLSSELKAIISASRIPLTLRPQAVHQFLLYGYAIDQRHTVVEGIERLLPGEYLVADESGICYKRYWQPVFGGGEGVCDRGDEEIQALLKEAVRLHLRSDVPVGVLLSAGIDSSAIASLAAHSDGDYVALCAGYPGNQLVDERPDAHRIANSLGMRYIDVVLDEREYEGCFDELCRCCDEPVGDRAAMAQWALYKHSRELGYKVLLTGNGGDEVFYGYPFWNTIAGATQVLPVDQQARWAGINQTAWVRRDRALLEGLVQPVLKEITGEAHECLYPLRDRVPWGPDAMAAVVFGTYLVHNGCLLTDKLGMGCSVEARVPLLDHVLIEAVLALPLHRRFDPVQSKPLLKRIMEPLLPVWVLAAPKRGFRPPIRYLERLLSDRRDLLRQGALVGEFLQAGRLRTLVDRQTALPWLRYSRVRKSLSIERSTEFLFRVLSFETWFRTMKGTRL